MSAEASPGHLRYLTRPSDVVRATNWLDPVALVRNTLVLHANGRTTLPEEAYLPWTNRAGAPSRSLALPGAVWGDEPAIGIKLINSSLGNHARGQARAQGLSVVFDPETAYPTAVMEAAHLSALRTAAYTALSMHYLGRAGITQIAVIGCGALGLMHARLLATRYPQTRLSLYDHHAEQLSAAVSDLRGEGVRCDEAPNAEAAVRGADVVVTATTVTSSYLPYAWLSPGALGP